MFAIVTPGPPTRVLRVQRLPAPLPPGAEAWPYVDDGPTHAGTLGDDRQVIDFQNKRVVRQYAIDKEAAIGRCKQLMGQLITSEYPIHDQLNGSWRGMEILDKYVYALQEQLAGQPATNPPTQEDADELQRLRDAKSYIDYVRTAGAQAVDALHAGQVVDVEAYFAQVRENLHQPAEPASAEP